MIGTILTKWCHDCGNDAKVLSHDKDSRTGVLVTVECVSCAIQWQTVLSKPKDEQAKDHDQEIKDILDTIGDQSHRGQGIDMYKVTIVWLAEYKSWTATEYTDTLLAAVLLAKRHYKGCNHRYFIRIEPTKQLRH